jgi:hypothetical protein
MSHAHICQVHGCSSVVCTELLHFGLCMFVFPWFPLVHSMRMQRSNCGGTDVWRGMSERRSETAMSHSNIWHAHGCSTVGLHTHAFVYACSLCTGLVHASYLSWYAAHGCSTVNLRTSAYVYACSLCSGFVHLGLCMPLMFPGMRRHSTYACTASIWVAQRCGVIGG